MFFLRLKNNLLSHKYILPLHTVSNRTLLENSMQNIFKNTVLITLLMAFLVVSTGFSSIFKRELTKEKSEKSSETTQNQQKSNEKHSKTPVFEEKTFDAVASATQIEFQDIYFKYLPNSYCYSSFISPQNLKCWQWKGFLANYYQCIFENFVVTNAP